ncbi:MAG: lysine--tRNA ligase [Candidatus Wildermuthbacteria bacterium RIFCSPHIGHO2_01_FULL_47_27]|uniref:Lysine--tRNA ligase n=2 Tax=Candidatus Wildermuthiibacteriota TaxID=1817923 RepID=A0A1G2RSK3_9BACT|nr:MAG: Lysine-tRNA ligase [Parcubacteria group bacterium GW2011_GWA2_47_9]OHA63344.1 MAG: lysine--tRNA ligase [Candidatus Wildermuthbacteria bacterium RIFCSPHIGHO2_01_FULL_47_27]OHA66948.1 MAG: lysine--tRNA ligase [Candidatus Wildermuthbacteria bacterium RIFCSPHIGHO2_02_FULL_47_17]OHA75826.1 MAG: lysine--tRNA ligase [Candidatus Wildermuthbacteria bacterium RIFCSPLOWO2_01_FULL_48_35]OHA76550.1 MAG: lysine--tRNA ligase [Candidatus Wildermuthbacteria bacterium RIFCSPLOWO2_02_FULL_47_10]
MARDTLKKIRIQKLRRIQKDGVNPYPARSGKTHDIFKVLADFNTLSAEKTKVTLTGRVRSLREHGGSTFLHFEDGTGTVQAYLKQDKLGGKKYKFFLENFDIGDFVAISGTLFTTKRGEKTVEAEDCRMLAKALLPLPEKWHGLKDVEERFRKRYLDFIMNPEARKIFETRSNIVKALRQIFDERGFIEVETPILQSLPGGALAKPFKTFLNALKMDLYLRIAPELYLKRLLVGGFEKTYEIGRCFRNEGMDWSHNPDFTMLELYWAYKDRDFLMEFVEDFISEVVKKIKNGEEVSLQGQSISFGRPWQKATFRELVKKYCDVDVESAKDAALRKKVKELKIRVGKEADRVALLDELYKKMVLQKLIQPTFVLDHPVEMAILAKAKEDNPKYADRFQLVVGGIELVNGFSELNDPLEQRRRFEKSRMAPERKDEDFLEALEYGMPPSAGLGMGIDRLVMLLTDAHSVREVIAFPTMKPRAK